MKKLAFVFPGQGSQHVGMLSSLYEQYSLVKDTFEEAGQALGFDLWGICTDESSDKINSTDITQPALLTSSTAIWRLWCESGGPQPAFVGGHSLGEFSALVASGSLEFTDAVKLVHSRGLFMQQAVPNGQGGMAAIIGLDEDKIEVCCKEVSDQSGQVVQCVNYNAPGQIVIAGHSDAVKSAAQLCKEAGARKAMVLSVSGPFHSSLMEPAAEKFREQLGLLEVKAPVIPVVQNVSNVAEVDPVTIGDNLVKQLSFPVNWIGAINYMVDNGVEAIVECGPGKVLSGLNKRISRSLNLASTQDTDALDNALKILND